MWRVLFCRIQSKLWPSEWLMQLWQCRCVRLPVKCLSELPQLTFRIGHRQISQRNTLPSSTMESCHFLRVHLLLSNLRRSLQATVIHCAMPQSLVQKSCLPSLTPCAQKSTWLIHRCPPCSSKLSCCTSDP